MKALSIGIFDSGVGGLTVLKEIKKLLPSENLIYLGDTARVPYGGRSPQAITRYALECALFLLTKGIKLLVIACNVSSAYALPIIKRKFPIPVLGVIEPGVKEAIRVTRKKRVGIIGTKGTIRSGVYERYIKKIDPQILVFSKACPLFVPIVEEGLENDEIAYLSAKKYLYELKDADVDTLVLGCTHYPVLENVIKAVLGDEIRIVHSGQEVAKAVRDLLEKKNLLAKNRSGTLKYFVTDLPGSFIEIGSRIMGEPITSVRWVRQMDFRNIFFSS
ncbi:MAG: glutamate racemase [Desulfobacterota bacterium]|nr:glutamate racemase [Thermodesulfobacteriota bacterium]MDW8002066.1 glutamate racemase [Deltaproteobacteria bacterium]